MTTAMTITIPVHDTAPRCLPAALEQRLATSPKSPEDLAQELAKHAAHTELLRKAHLEAVKDRATRETQRVAEAAARKRRIAANQIEKVQKRLDAADVMLTARREAIEAKRERMKARRNELAQMVAESRARKVAQRDAAHAEALETEISALKKAASHIKAVHDRSARVVKHAEAVVAAQKEKEQTEKAAAAANLAERLHAAESRRQATTPPRAVSHASGPARLFRVLNDHKIEAAMKDIAYKKAMERAQANREALVQGKAEKAHADNVRAADKAAAAQARSAGTDTQTAATKIALYQKLQNADVTRKVGLKQRGMTKYKGDTTCVIVVRIEKETPRTPPPALVRRLTEVSHKLLATASTRQAGAASRRAAARAALALALAKASGKRADALGKVRMAQEAHVAKMKGRAARSFVARALFEGRRAHLVAQAHRRSSAAMGARKAAAAKLELNGKVWSDKCAAAAERRAAALRKVAKRGVVSVRNSATKSRREALRAAFVQRAKVLAARCEAAALFKASKLAEVVAKAKATAAKRKANED